MATITSESNSPHRPVWAVHPRQVRDTLQRQIQYTVDSSVNSIMNFTNGNVDGRYLMSEPIQVRRAANDLGYRYHIVGENTMDDVSVAAP